MQITKQRKCQLFEPKCIEWDLEIVALTEPYWCFLIVELRAVWWFSFWFISFSTRH